MPSNRKKSKEKENLFETTHSTPFSIPFVEAKSTVIKFFFSLLCSSTQAWMAENIFSSSDDIERYIKRSFGVTRVALDYAMLDFSFGNMRQIERETRLFMGEWVSCIEIFSISQCCWSEHKTYTCSDSCSIWKDWGGGGKSWERLQLAETWRVNRQSSLLPLTEQENLNCCEKVSLFSHL